MKKRLIYEFTVCAFLQCYRFATSSSLSKYEEDLLEDGAQESWLDRHWRGQYTPPLVVCERE
jgi:hypothetical protein